MARVVLITGANLGPVAENLAEAERLLAETVGRIVLRSSLRESEPWGFEADERFLNQVLAIETPLSPERVEYFVDKSGTEEIVTKENWDLEYDVDMNELFGPITMERMQEKIRRDEQARLREIAKKRAEQEKNGRQSSAAGGNRNNSNNYNGYGNTGGLGGTGGMIRR